MSWIAHHSYCVIVKTAARSPIQTAYPEKACELAQEEAMQYLSCMAARSAEIVQMHPAGVPAVQVWKYTVALSKCMVEKSRITM